MALGGRWQILLGGRLLLASYATRAPLQRSGDKPLASCASAEHTIKIDQ